MTTRRTLPNRRPLETFEFDLDGTRYTASAGFFETGGLAELFLRAGKPGSAVEVTSHDAAVVLSLSLQFGAPLNAIRRALTKLPDGSAAGPLGRALDIIEAGGAG
jgi:ribonucleoside-diphosphate reductase alpha chain